MLCLLLPLAGCESFGKAMTVKNPVVPPPPQRVANLLPENNFDAPGKAYVDDVVFSEPEKKSENVLELLPNSSEEGGVRQARMEQAGERLPERLPSAEVAALVNGVPIFVDDVLERFAVGLFQAEKQIEKMPPGPARESERKQLRRTRQDLVKREIKGHIERQLLIQALKSKAKEEQIKGMDKHFDLLFDQEIKKMLKVMNVSTLAELDVELAKSGSSVDSQRANFKNQKLAHQYMGMNLPKPALDRPDLLAYYQSHVKEFEYVGQVKWQQIVLPYGEYGGKPKAQKLAGQILAKLNKGTDFAALAKKYSKGATAQAGGFHDFTRAGSFADEKVELALFELPPGATSPVLEGENSLQIVRLIERKDAGRKSFESVQEDIKEAIREEQFRKYVAGMWKDLYENASIQMMFEGEEVADRSGG